MEKSDRKEAVCGKEALDLLNCVTESPYDPDKCVRFLQSLRDCVINKKVKKFLLDNQDHPEGNPGSKKA